MSAVRRGGERPGGQVLAAVRSQLRKGWPAGLTVLGGNDVYHLDLAQKEILAALVPEGESDYCLSVYGDERVEVASVVAAARSQGMFASRRVVLVRDVTALDGEPDALTEYGGNPPPESYLLVRAPALDRRRKLHKELARAGKLLQFQQPRGADPVGARAELQAMADERGLKLDRAAADLLMLAFGSDLYRLSSELDKIRAWLGARAKRVTLDAVREVASAGGGLTGWEVADAVTRRDRAAALAAARRLVDGGDEPIKIVGGLASRARSLLQAKVMLEHGAGEEQVISATRSWYFKESLFDGLKRYTMPELLAFPATLLAADRTLKSRSIDPRAVLEELVDRLTQPTRAAHHTERAR